MNNLHPCFFSDCLQWGFSTLGCGNLSLDEILALAKTYGIDAIELRTAAGSPDLVGIMREYRENAPERYRALRDSGIIKMFDTSFKLINPTEMDYEDLIDIAKTADDLHVPFCRVFGGLEYVPEPSPEALQQAAQTLTWWHELREKHHIGCQLALETHDFFSSAESCRRLFNVAGRWLPIVWDVHHTWRYGGETFAKSMEILRDHIVHVHVKDSICLDGKVHSVLPGKGKVPIPELLMILRQMAFKPTVSLEWERWWEPELPPLSEALDAVRESWLPRQR